MTIKVGMTVSHNGEVFQTPKPMTRKSAEDHAQVLSLLPADRRKQVEGRLNRYKRSANGKVIQSIKGQVKLIRDGIAVIEDRNGNIHHAPVEGCVVLSPSDSAEYWKKAKVRK